VSTASCCGDGEQRGIKYGLVDVSFECLYQVGVFSQQLGQLLFLRFVPSVDLLKQVLDHQFQSSDLLQVNLASRACPGHEVQLQWWQRIEGGQRSWERLIFQGALVGEKIKGICQLGGDEIAQQLRRQAAGRDMGKRYLRTQGDRDGSSDRRKGGGGPPLRSCPLEPVHCTKTNKRRGFARLGSRSRPRASGQFLEVRWPTDGSDPPPEDLLRGQPLIHRMRFSQIFSSMPLSSSGVEPPGDGCKVSDDPQRSRSAKRPLQTKNFTPIFPEPDRSIGALPLALFPRDVRLEASQAPALVLGDMESSRPRDCSPLARQREVKRRGSRAASPQANGVLQETVGSFAVRKVEEVGLVALSVRR
jgi:hypothetical protein